MNSEKMQKIADEILSSVNNFSNCIKNINNIVEDISQAWVGIDATKYVKAFKEKNIPELNHLSEILNDYGNYLKQISTIYECFDEIYSSKNIG